ncbi:MAG: LysR substrate-binding domain-containing protein [Litoreibacter sp.]|nr:LysR substrate-binding domain-containing protein [Litoreibacter sp.]MCY4334022.1 LysR substrate-binding domain-containing protein [Litoreibacter sp.]
MREFLAVIRAGSISEAARGTGVPRATLRRRIVALEADLGVRLIVRRTTRLALTHAGEELLKRAERIIADADAAWDSVRRLDDTPRGLLRVSLAGALFPTLFTAFLREFPEVKLEVQSTTRYVDLLADGVDVAMRIGPVKDQDLIARLIHTDRQIVVAAPDYLNSAPTLFKASDLRKHDCLLGFAGEWTSNRNWPLRSGGTVAVNGRLAANDIGILQQACLDGLGCALIASAVVAEDIHAGRLVPVLLEEIGTELPISLVYADREYIDPKVREFIDRAVKVIAREMPKPWSGTTT